MNISSGHSQAKSNKPPLRILTATALFDGHDVAINVIRRLLQDHGIEVIHLGFNRSAQAVVSAAIQEDVDAIAVSSYQGGHLHYFEYLLTLLKENQAEDIQVFTGGGGTITEKEARQLEAIGVNRVYTAQDGVSMGLEGMINDLIDRLHKSRRNLPLKEQAVPNLQASDRVLGQVISQIEVTDSTNLKNLSDKNTYVIGIAGTGGAGKSTFIDELLNALLQLYPTIRIAYLAVDPSQQKTGGALLGDRIRINTLPHPRLFMRSLATRQANVSLSKSVKQCIPYLTAQGFELIIIESAGIGQNDTSIVELADFSLYLMTRDYGSPSQLEKIEMLQFANAVILNKADLQGSEDAYRDIIKQRQRNFKIKSCDDSELAVFPMVSSHHQDTGFKCFINFLSDNLAFTADNKVSKQFENVPYDWSSDANTIKLSNPHYLSDISHLYSDITKETQQQIQAMQQAQSHYHALSDIGAAAMPNLLEDYDLKRLPDNDPTLKKLAYQYNKHLSTLTVASTTAIQKWLKQEDTSTKQGEEVEYGDHKQAFVSLSGLHIPFIAKPDKQNLANLLEFLNNENLPGSYPFTAGVFPSRNTSEEPTRMFAGEGTPEDTNWRFHYLIKNQKSIRLSTAFDPNTLYGEDPSKQSDIFGCIGMSGVSIATLDDMKKLYSGIDLCDERTSVSLTINGPAPIAMAWFLHTAIDQQVETYLKTESRWPEAKRAIADYFDKKNQPQYLQELPANHNGLGLALLGMSGELLLEPEIYQKIKLETFKKLRGTLQADILKEEISQNECIFALDFSLSMMADMQCYFINESIKKFYAVSVSGYHIAEAGANPVTQLAFTLANGFTLIEYYLARGLKINDFAPHLSFFFSNGMDPEYAVIGRVARRIWSRTLKQLYGATEVSQKLKYHIQTSGRSLQAQEIDLNDIRTTLQAVYAIYDNCNSLHTNAYDEAITTPTEESVYRALSIQTIINREFGLNKNQNPLQGSYIIRYLTDQVEAAVYQEFNRLAQRGGVLGAIETGYQRNKIQDESKKYESLKSTQQFELVGVNTFIREHGGEPDTAKELIRSTDQKKQQQITAVNDFKQQHRDEATKAIQTLKSSISTDDNSFYELMKASTACTLSQLTHALYEVGGKYRRSM